MVEKFDYGEYLPESLLFVRVDNCGDSLNFKLPAFAELTSSEWSIAELIFDESSGTTKRKAYENLLLLLFLL